jgi:hypothetical protein
MSFPGHEQDNPQRIATAVNTAGFAQDVVMAISRLIHDQDLSEDDRTTLEHCRVLLNGMLSTDIPLARSGERRLGGTNTVALLRKARMAQPQDAGDLASMIMAMDRLLAGERDGKSLEQAHKLRNIFLAVGKANLADMTRHDPRRDASDNWTGLIANSIS